MKHHQILVAVVLFLISLLGLAGCEDPDAAEKDAIMDSLRQLDQANIDCDGAAAVAVMSSEGIADYTRWSTSPSTARASRCWGSSRAS